VADIALPKKKNLSYLADASPASQKVVGETFRR